MCFAASSGSIGKYGGIVSIQYAVQKVLGSRLVDIALRGVFVKDLVESKGVIFCSFRSWSGISREAVYWFVFWRVKYPGYHQQWDHNKGTSSTYRHLSSTTLIIGLMPFWPSFGVGAAARDPSPRKRGPSSHFVSCAASRIVKGRTRTATVMEEAPSDRAVAILNDGMIAQVQIQARFQHSACSDVNGTNSLGDIDQVELRLVLARRYTHRETAGPLPSCCPSNAPWPTTSPYAMLAAYIYLVVTNTGRNVARSV